MGKRAKPSVLFVCIANSCRSQMAEAIARSLVGDQWHIASAGSSPGGRVHPLAVELMKELHLDLSAHYSKGIEALPATMWDYVVSMGCGDNCPTVPARQRLDWKTPDPIAMPPEDARKVRDTIATQVKDLLKQGGGHDHH